ncbi:GNAT family N-acetyltransferase [Amycolatopsis sp. NPDC051372]|uniref:GNAT family N-acetyltransferase n=1 Tax=Amycolatopsis sp. NPDC051372 TaxID=3155669 RepID=UPI0034180CAD
MWHEYCLNGHRLDVAGRNSSFDADLWLGTAACNLCYELRLPRASWAVVGLRFAHEAPPGRHYLRLVAHPPQVRAGVGQILLELHGTPLGDLGVRMCSVDERGVIEQVRVDDDCRRHGVGTVLVTAALARTPGYAWSTTALENTTAARAFWAAYRPAVPLQLGEPAYCSHMREADGEYG